MTPPLRLRAQQLSERFTLRLQQVDLECRLGTARRNLDVLLELCDLQLQNLVALTGGTVQTRAFERDLEEARRKVESRWHLRVVS